MTATLMTVLILPRVELRHWEATMCQLAVAALHQGVQGQMPWALAKKLLPWLNEISINFINVVHKNYFMCYKM